MGAGLRPTAKVVDKPPNPKVRAPVLDPTVIHSPRRPVWTSGFFQEDSQGINGGGLGDPAYKGSQHPAPKAIQLEEPGIKDQLLALERGEEMFDNVVHLIEKVLSILVPQNTASHKSIHLIREGIKCAGCGLETVVGQAI